MLPTLIEPVHTRMQRCGIAMPSVLASWLLLRTVAIPWVPSLHETNCHQHLPAVRCIMLRMQPDVDEARRHRLTSAVAIRRLTDAKLSVRRCLCCAYSIITCGFFCSGMMTPHHTVTVTNCDCDIHTHTSQVPRQAEAAGDE
jgi:hypothetical protein